MKNNGVLEYRSSGGMSTEKEQSPGFVPLVTIWNVNGGEILENGEYRKKLSVPRKSRGLTQILKSTPVNGDPSVILESKD